MTVTQRDLAETISEMHNVARDLRETADDEPIVGTKGKAVPASIKGLRSSADFLDQVVQELRELLDDEKPIVVPKEDPTLSSEDG